MGFLENSRKNEELLKNVFNGSKICFDESVLRDEKKFLYKGIFKTRKKILKQILKKFESIIKLKVNAIENNFKFESKIDNNFEDSNSNLLVKIIVCQKNLRQRKIVWDFKKKSVQHNAPILEKSIFVSNSTYLLISSKNQSFTNSTTIPKIFNFSSFSRKNPSVEKHSNSYILIIIISISSFFIGLLVVICWYARKIKKSHFPNSKFLNKFSSCV